MTKKKSIPAVEAVKHPYYVTYSGTYDCHRLVHAYSEADILPLVMENNYDWSSLGKLNPKSITVKALDVDMMSIIADVEEMVGEWKYNYEDCSLMDINDSLSSVINTIKDNIPEPIYHREKFVFDTIPETVQMNTGGYESLEKSYYTIWKGKFKACEIIYAVSEADAIDKLKHSKGSTLARLDLKPQAKTVKTRLVDEAITRIVGHIEVTLQTWKYGWDYDIDDIRKDLAFVVNYIDEHYDELRDSTRLHKAVDSRQ